MLIHPPQHLFSVRWHLVFSVLDLLLLNPSNSHAKDRPMRGRNSVVVDEDFQVD